MSPTTYETARCAVLSTEHNLQLAHAYTNQEGVINNATLSGDSHSKLVHSKEVEFQPLRIGKCINIYVNLSLRTGPLREIYLGFRH